MATSVASGDLRWLVSDLRLTIFALFEESVGAILIELGNRPDEHDRKCFSLGEKVSYVLFAIFFSDRGIV